LQKYTRGVEENVAVGEGGAIEKQKPGGEKTGYNSWLTI